MQRRTFVITLISISMHGINSIIKSGSALFCQYPPPPPPTHTHKHTFEMLSLKPAAHESYLLSKNSLVTIGVSKSPRMRRRFKSFCSRVPFLPGRREQKIISSHLVDYRSGKIILHAQEIHLARSRNSFCPFKKFILPASENTEQIKF